MSDLKVTFEPDGTIRTDSTGVAKSAEEKRSLLEKLAAKLGGSISEEEHKPQYEHEQVHLHG